MSPEAKPARIVRCPGCGAATPYSTANPYRPFCSAHCKNNDFGAWASEDYGVPASPQSGDGDPASDPPSR
jgi:endogenous inhibitor of DNA gyrase (YacG/DUF329 family)